MTSLQCDCFIFSRACFCFLLWPLVVHRRVWEPVPFVGLRHKAVSGQNMSKHFWAWSYVPGVRNGPQIKTQVGQLGAISAKVCQRLLAMSAVGVGCTNNRQSTRLQWDTSTGIWMPGLDFFKAFAWECQAFWNKKTVFSDHNMFCDRVCPSHSAECSFCSQLYTENSVANETIASIQSSRWFASSFDIRSDMVQTWGRGWMTKASGAGGTRKGMREAQTRARDRRRAGKEEKDEEKKRTKRTKRTKRKKRKMRKMRKIRKMRKMKKRTV